MNFNAEFQTLRRFYLLQGCIFKISKTKFLNHLNIYRKLRNTLWTSRITNQSLNQTCLEEPEPQIKQTTNKQTYIPFGPLGSPICQSPFQTYLVELNQLILGQTDHHDDKCTRK
jgi:hypothetical protein